uniref:Uncharacterized protein n=1 Tax=Cebus imitator TaxID=2715852 RepID=A0A2K5PMP2_CEBIM
MERCNSSTLLGNCIKAVLPCIICKYLLRQNTSKDTYEMYTYFFLYSTNFFLMHFFLSRDIETTDSSFHSILNPSLVYKTNTGHTGPLD